MSLKIDGLWYGYCEICDERLTAKHSEEEADRHSELKNCIKALAVRIARFPQKDWHL